jgi:hypothetical protein
LSPRMLIYSNTTIRWPCRFKSKCDGGSEDILGSHQIGKLQGSQPDITSTPGRRWRSIVKEYSRRILSNGEDKLPAVSAITEEHADETQDQYIAGLWRKSLAYDLFWIVQSWHENARRPADFRAPSWSWAALNEPVGWLYGGDIKYIRQDESFELLDYSPSLKHKEALFGGLTGGKLRLRCRIAYLGSKKEVMEKALGFVVDPTYTVRFDDLECGDASKGVYGLVCGRRTWDSEVPVGLLLCEVASSNGKAYQRIGIFWNGALTAEDLNNGTAEEVTIV